MTEKPRRRTTRNFISSTEVISLLLAGLPIPWENVPWWVEEILKNIKISDTPKRFPAVVKIGNIYCKIFFSRTFQNIIDNLRLIREEKKYLVNTTIIKFIPRKATEKVA